MSIKNELDNILTNIWEVDLKLQSFLHVLKKLEDDAMHKETENKELFYLMTFVCDHISYIQREANACGSRLDALLSDSCVEGFDMSNLSMKDIGD